MPQLAWFLKVAHSSFNFPITLTADDTVFMKKYLMIADIEEFGDKFTTGKEISLKTARQVTNTLPVKPDYINSLQDKTDSEWTET